MSSSVSTVLLVEDDIVARSPLAEYLRECGFTVIEAASAEEAKTALRVPELKIEVVLAHTGANGGGFALRQWVAAEKLDVEVVLAGSVDKAIDSAGSICSEGPALARPYEHHMVRDQIRQAIARRERALGRSAG